MSSPPNHRLFVVSPPSPGYNNQCLEKRSPALQACNRTRNIQADGVPMAHRAPGRTRSSGPFFCHWTPELCLKKRTSDLSLMGLTGLGPLLPKGPAPQHRPHHTDQIVCRGHQRDLLPLRIAALDPLEIRADRRRATQRLPGGLGHQLTHDRRARAGDVPQPVLVARLILARDQSEIATDRLGIAKAVRVIHEGGHRFGRADPHSRDATQLTDGGSVPRLTAQLLLEAAALAVERLDLLQQQVPPQLLRERGQVELTEPGQALLRPESGMPGGVVAVATTGLVADLEAVGQGLEKPQDLVQAAHLAALDELPLLAEHAEGDTRRVNIQTDVKHKSPLEIEERQSQDG